MMSNQAAQKSSPTTQQQGAGHRLCSFLWSMLAACLSSNLNSDASLAQPCRYMALWWQLVQRLCCASSAWFTNAKTSMC